MLDLTLIAETQYSDTARNAVRYGYQYRLEAEKGAGSSCMHFHISEASVFLNWLADLIIGGIAFDLIKKYAKQLWNKLMQMKIEIPDDVNVVLIDEDELRRFVKYVNEFNNHCMSTTDKEAAYIREEIIADYLGNHSGEIFDKGTGQINLTAWRRLSREANEYADNLIKRK